MHIRVFSGKLIMKKQNSRKCGLQLNIVLKTLKYNGTTLHKQTTTIKVHKTKP